MSLFNAMRTSISGMAAQSNALSTISDNIANAGTTGYKRATAEFETLLGVEATSSYESGGVITDIRYGVSTQGTLTTTTSATDLAISGNGFFPVAKDGNTNYLTRAGSFAPDQDGNLVNSAGYSLLGYAMVDGKASSTLSVVNVATTPLQASASTSGTLTANFPSTESPVAAASLPSTNAAGAKYSDKTSITAYDNLGNAVTLDVYVSKTNGTAPADNTWEVTAYNSADANAVSGGFPYSKAAVGSTNIDFDPTTGKLTSASPTSFTATIPNGNAGGVKIDLSQTTQLATAFGITSATANGNAPSQLDHVKVGKDGTLTAVYSGGTQVVTYKIPLANVNSPDNLTPVTGNVYEASQKSGAVVLNTPGSGGTGSIIADALEQSTVDLATELTNMIQAQRSYEANSKVLQTGSDMLSVLNRITTN